MKALLVHQVGSPLSGSCKSMNEDTLSDVSQDDGCSDPKASSTRMVPRAWRLGWLI